jgi:hypothetical protein
VTVNWPPGFWAWIRNNKDELELGHIEPLSIHLLDPEAEPDDA